MRKPRQNLLTEKQMTPEVYRLRREVIAWVYRAKALVPSLPRITVRVCDASDKHTACAIMGTCEIFITEGYVASHRTVLHEILHAVYKAPHVPGCPLMDGTFRKISVEQAEELFVEYARKFQNA